MIIAYSGKIGSGKDLAGKITQALINKPTTFEGMEVITEDDIDYKVWDKPRFEIKKFADKLKNSVCILLNCTREQLEDREFKEKELGEEWWHWKLERDGGYSTILLPYNESTGTEDYTLVKLTPRLLLQLLGTQCGRQIIHPNCWLNALFVDYVQGDIEIWKDIKNYEGRYQISNFGRIKGLDRKIVYGDVNKGEYHTKKESILKTTISGKYEMIKLEGNNSLLVHRLVAKHFIEKVENKTYVNHIDQNPLNNFYKNLEWCTQSENIISANKAGNGNIGEKQSDAKLDEEKVLKIKELLKTNIRQKEIAKMFNVGQTTITDIKKGRKWKHIGVKKQPIASILPKSGSKWIITDMRFPNELKAVKDKGGITIRINRPLSLLHPQQWKHFIKYISDKDNSFKQNEDEFKDYLLTGTKEQEDLHYKLNHPSETALDNAEFDYVIDNNGTIKDLVHMIKDVLIINKLI